MGNNIGGRKKAKIMKINGEVFKLRLPAVTQDVLKHFPGHVLLEPEAVKKYGIRAEPLEPEEELKANKIYFLVELPKLRQEKTPTRSRSAVHMDAKEWIALRRRSISEPPGAGSGSVRVKMRLSKAEIEKLIEESKDEREMAEKIIDLFLLNSSKEIREQEHV
ncbi:unnamed protein product [Fraxinus pennsylvanica]|uniref:Uncharacterized protein n=1 Tax=Fraxinus pennsylvanica TaxID=56036 RepID=A0AAD1ZY84_9LAMI|nr:unnamed protein product [Fraxinus pennsylvanica]